MTGQPYKHATAAHLLENAIQYAIVEEMQNSAGVVNSPKSTIAQAAHHKHLTGKQGVGSPLNQAVAADERQEMQMGSCSFFLDPSGAVAATTKSDSKKQQAVAGLGKKGKTVIIPSNMV